MLALAISLAAYLAASVVVGAPWPIAIAAGLALWFAAWWYLLCPRGARLRRDPRCET